MNRNTLRIAFAFMLVGSAACGRSARADVLIHPVSVTGAGNFSNSAGLLIDGFLPPRFTPYTDPTNVGWTDPATTFTINLGAVYTVTNLTAYVDNNDDYVVQSSTDGVHFTNLFTFLASDGQVTPGQGGIDILTTIATNPTSPADLTTPAFVGRTFAPVQASYLRLIGQNGDSLYAAGELQAYAAGVPEPSPFLLGAGGVLVVACVRLRRRGRRTA